MRDMAITMGLLVAVVLVAVGLYGGFSVAPGRPADGPTPTADVTAGFARAAPAVGFAVAIPQDLPAEWQANSFSLVQDGTEALPTVRAGWITPDGRFVTLIQSRGSAAQVLPAELGDVGAVTGTEAVGDASWQVTTGRRDEAAWFLEADGVVRLITGTATPEAFGTLAGSLVVE